ncbi:MAG: rRNA maturation RNase YbeY [Bacteroidetes bacterium]|nr:MAG: rRNA maturation RNase YbeY [Bacteroidota bacterium]
MQFPTLPIPDEPESGVSFFFEDVTFDLPDQPGLSAWLQEIARQENKPFIDLNFIFCSDEYLREVNVEYLQHDYYTDVITFPYTEGTVHGDIFISSDRVADNARELRIPFLRELYRVMAHGVLHLAGYGDKSPEEEKQMREKEDYYLATLPE